MGRRIFTRVQRGERTHTGSGDSRNNSREFVRRARSPPSVASIFTALVFQARLKVTVACPGETKKKRKQEKVKISHRQSEMRRGLKRVR